MNIRGFSLLELLFAITIIAILAGIATPLYKQHIQKAHTLDGQIKLMEIMRLEQRHFVRNLSYTDNLASDFSLTIEAGGVPSDQGFYHISAQACDSNLSACIKLTATPVDDSQPVLTLNSKGQRAPADIW